MIALTVAAAVLVGVTLGVLGGGGSILMVPLLAYVAGMDAKVAIATSLLVVGTTSAVGAISHARAGRVQWRVGLVFGAAGMAGAYLGGLLARAIPGTVLLIGFALVMVATAAAMLRGRKNAAQESSGGALPIPKALALGLVVGLVTGLIGAGGGFVVVPALVLLGGLSMPVAVGTSLVVITMNSFAGLAGYLSSVQIYWPLALMVTVAAVIGGLIGARLTAYVNPDVLRKAFGWFVLAMSSVIFAQEIHPAVGISVAVLVVIAAVVSASSKARVARRRSGVLGPHPASHHRVNV
ncbi:sulfite exporter TauE/SafE family protein [Mycobacterium sp. OTB74]|uniref:sulfite exporter TauE/SafE family protein n=1 Tax=Mycobacterium sp. OTB74 TaxID=1853452 RepID=UPI002474988B|nr:sulfite exporter TauE/SafE family protein [Mycobacterium sp. OTB74]MDH6247606.1 putative membrane protein YfcA [Mycobacterium sp. OTB74]